MWVGETWSLCWASGWFKCMCQATCTGGQSLYRVAWFQRLKTLLAVECDTAQGHQLMESLKAPKPLIGDCGHPDRAWCWVVYVTVHGQVTVMRRSINVNHNIGALDIDLTLTALWEPRQVWCKW